MKKTKQLRNKGKSLIDFPKDYVVIDIETTGLDPKYDNIIELAAIKVRNSQTTDTFSTLINPDNYIDNFISDLTGITNDMVANSPKIEIAIIEFYNFIKNDILVGHNINFDLNFIYDELIKHNIVFDNNFVDTLRISRLLFKDLKKHRLVDLAEKYNVNYQKNHRALNDCEITLEIYNNMYDAVISDFKDINDFKRRNRSNRNNYLNPNYISTIKTEFDEEHPIYNKTFVFTGTLEKLTRKDAMQLVVDFGGSCSNSVTTKINYLVLGNNDYSTTIKNGKSNKQKKAEELILKNHDLNIISENVFYDMIED